MPRTKNHRRSGSMYVVALGTSMLVTVIGLSAIVTSRIEHRYAEGASDLQQARLHARSAIEWGMWKMNNDQSWRKTQPHGDWLLNKGLGEGSFSLNVIDPADSDLSDSSSDPVILTGTGSVGPAAYRLSLNMAAYGPPGMDCLASAVHAGVYAETGTTLTIDAPISSNGTMQIGLTGRVNGSVEAVSTITNNGAVTGSVTTGITAKEMPAATVFDYYLGQAVEIAYASIPSGTIDRQLFSPASNPYGATHSKGMYLVRCNGAQIVIKNTRLSGTLIILDPGPGSLLDGAMVFQNYDTTLPTLMVRGSMEFKWSGTLSESSSNKNYNPTTSPYQGVGDSDIADSYASIVRGLVYLSGNLTITGTETIEGAVVTGGNVVINQNLNVTHDANLINAPPPGFERSYRPMSPVAGTWRQVVD